MKKNLLLFAVFLLGIISTQAQTTFGLKISEVSNDGTDYVISLSIQMVGDNPSVMNLGSSAFQFSFPSAALSNPVLVSTTLSNPIPYYLPTVTSPLSGECSFNVELANSGFGLEVVEAPGWTEVGLVSFTIDDANALIPLSWSYNGGTTQTVVYLDDEATQIFATSPEEDNLIFESLGSSNVRLVQVNPNNNQITIKNFGELDEDISSWRLCSNFNYTNSGMQGDAALTLINGDYILSTDEEVVVEWTPGSGFRLTGDDIGLYLATGAFNSPEAMVDFTQYLSAGNGRESVAVAKGIWSTGDFVSGDAPYSYIGDGSENGVTFWEGSLVIDDCTELLISEYGEPNGGNGKYIELYNSSDSDIDLSTYSIWKLGNGGIWPETEMLLTGLISSGGKFVIANNDSDVPGADIYDSGFINFNGDDAIGLAKEGVLIDAVGEDGDDPGSGFDVAGVVAGTQNHTLIRKETVLAPSPNWTMTAGTDTTDSQWEVITYSINNVGIHVTACVEAVSDTDGDGIDDLVDNCPSISNQDQADLDQDGTGDVCDNDIDGDGVINDDDCAPMDAAIYPGLPCDDGNEQTINDIIQSNCSCLGTTPIAPCTDLLISEYGEPDGGNGKYIELYNSSDTEVALSLYSIWKISNGGNWPETELLLSGNLAAGATYVIANNDIDVPSADLYDSGIINFNGDDAMGLAKEGILIDAVGQDGADPGSGFDVAGVTSGTQNQTLIRKATVQAPNSNWTASAGTDSISSEWLVVTYNIVNVGIHDSSCSVEDTDGDGIADADDNCPNTDNSLQEDMDSDQIGDACDDDIDGDGIANEDDCDPLSIDTTAPTFTSVPADITIECDEEINVMFAEGMDDCEEFPVITYQDETMPQGCLYMIIRTWIITDQAGNSTTATQQITVIDSITPEITNIPADITLSCGSDIPDPIIAEAIDNCDAEVEITFEETTEGVCPQTITRVWTATDDCGNSETFTQIISLIEATIFEFTFIPQNGTIECDDVIPTDMPVAIAPSPCEDISIDFNDESDFDGCQTVITRTFTATDGCDNIITAVQLIYIVDTSSPLIISQPVDAAYQCAGNVPAPVEPEMIDLCDNDLEMTYSETNEGICPMEISRIWIYTDNCGNTTEVVQIITVEDTEAPEVSVLEDESYQCFEDVTLTATPFATDNCDINITMIYDEVTEGECPMIITRTWTFSDDCGNETTSTQIITVQDMIAPVVSELDNESFQCMDDVTDAIDPTATDNCDDDLTMSYEESTDGDCPVIITRTWTYTDDCGNVTTSTQIITVEDTEAPILSNIPEDMVLECGDAMPEIIDPIATDNCDSLLESEFSADVVGDCPSTVEWTWFFTDACGNEVTHTQTIQFDDPDAIDEINGNLLSLSFSPNPANAFANLMLELNKNEDLQIMIYNSLGQIVSSQDEQVSIGVNNISIPVSNYENGVYWIKINGNSISKTISFLKE